MGEKRRVLSSKLIDHATERPDIAFGVVGFVKPYLRTCIVGSTGLSLHETKLCYFAHVKVSEFDLAIFAEKDVSTLDVSVNDFQ